MIAVVDTNVLLTAEGLADHASLRCRANCATALDDLVEDGIFVIDSANAIVKEYSNKLAPARQNAGARFLMHVYNNQRNPERCHRIAITPDDNRGFEEFPDHHGLSKFDVSDRKFVAVALAHPNHPPIFEAVERGFWNHLSTLEECGVRIEFLCAPKSWFR